MDPIVYYIMYVHNQQSHCTSISVSVKKVPRCFIPKHCFLAMFLIFWWLHHDPISGKALQRPCTAMFGWDHASRVNFGLVAASPQKGLTPGPPRWSQCWSGVSDHRISPFLAMGFAFICSGCEPHIGRSFCKDRYVYIYIHKIHY